MAMRQAQHAQHQLESTHARGGVRSLIGRRRRHALAAAGLLFALVSAMGQSSAPPVIAGRAGTAQRRIEPVTAAQAATRRTAAADGEPKLVVAIFRHGVRSPLEHFASTADDYSKLPWPILPDWTPLDSKQKWGDLTLNGYKRASALGSSELRRL